MARTSYYGYWDRIHYKYYSYMSVEEYLVKIKGHKSVDCPHCSIHLDLGTSTVNGEIIRCLECGGLFEYVEE